MTGLVVDPGSIRADVGLPGDTPDGNKASITQNFRSPEQLDAAAFPTILYRSTRCARGAGDLVSVTGELTIRGVKREITVPMRISGDGATLAASGAFDLTHADFGMAPFRAVGGSLRNQERLDFLMDVRGTASPTTPAAPRPDPSAP